MGDRRRLITTVHAVIGFVFDARAMSNVTPSESNEYMRYFLVKFLLVVWCRFLYEKFPCFQANETCYQKPHILTFFEPIESCPHRHFLFQIHFNVIVKFTRRCLRWHLSLTFCDQISMNFSSDPLCVKYIADMTILGWIILTVVKNESYVVAQYYFHS